MEKLFSVLLRDLRMSIEIRKERPDEMATVRDLNERAFGQDQEGNIVDALRANRAALLSLVATLNNRVVGHIMYSPAIIAGNVAGAALGPMAVLPECQRQRIGSKLIEAGNRTLKDSGCPFVIVVGHAEYYPRFGFRPASEHGIKCEWDVPDDVFMLLVLDEAKMLVFPAWPNIGTNSQAFLRCRIPRPREKRGKTFPSCGCEIMIVLPSN
jgi:putative acetyltransferase